MAEKRRILIADPDIATVRALKGALADDFEILTAKDGSRALELSVLKYPDLILFHRHCPLIGATQFLRILRTNPRTEEVPLIVLSEQRLAADAPPGYLEGVLVKPLNLDEVRAHITSVFHKVDTAKQVVEETGAVSGSLDQVSMADLLQIFSVNRRSGCLQVSGGTRSEAAEIFLHDGRIEDATVGHARGAKALYRLLCWTGGRFSFVPGQRATAVTLNASTDTLLMEGMRQGDELERMRHETPGPDAMLERLVAADGLPDGLHRVTAEIFHLAEYYPRMLDLTDRANATDLEVCVAVRDLVDAQLLRVREGTARPVARALLSSDEVLDLRSRLRRAGLAPTYLASPRVAVVARDAESIRQLGVALAQLSEFSASNLQRLSRVPFGGIGSLRLDSTTSVDFFAVPAEERLLPLAFGMSAGTVAAVVVGTVGLEAIEPTLEVLERERRAALLFVRRPVEPKLAPSGRRTVLEVEDLSDESTRRLVGVLFKQVAGTDLRGVGL